MKLAQSTALSWLIGTSVATGLDKKVQFKVIPDRVSFRNAPQLCQSHGYDLAPFHERVIPLILHSMVDAHVHYVWGAGSSIAPATIMKRHDAADYDLNVTFANKQSSVLKEHHAVLCVKRRKHLVGSSPPSSSSPNSVSTGPSLASSTNSGNNSNESDLWSSSNKKAGHKQYRHTPILPTKKKSHKKDYRKGKNREMVIVSERKNPRLTVRVNGQAVDPFGEHVQHLIQELGKMPLDHLNNKMNLQLTEGRRKDARQSSRHRNLSVARVNPTLVHHYCPDISDYSCPIRQIWDRQHTLRHNRHDE